jgi:FkbM family methyltransferase
MPLTIDLVNEIASKHDQHARSSKWWEETNEKYTALFSEEFRQSRGNFGIGAAGEVSVKNIDFGSISSAHLFGLDELIIFAWYEINVQNYKKTLDLGANIGVHSMLMSKYGFDVTAYEPDPHHIELFFETMRENGTEIFSLRQKAIGITSEKLNFTRVLGNTTGSHLSGAKANPYGDLEVFEVEVDDISEVMSEGYDFVKMDVEGYEVKLISALKAEHFSSMDIMLEIGTAENATEMFAQLKRLGINAFSQKKNWEKVNSLQDLPTSHREGSLFLTSSSNMSWSSQRG